MLRNQRAYQFIYDWTKNRCAAAVGAWGGRMVGRAAVGLLGCLKKEQMSENALLQAAEAAKKCYLRPAADTDGWQALQPFGQTEVLVSVIVPVHNGEKDLRQCLNSILANRNAHRNGQILFLLLEDPGAYEEEKRNLCDPRSDSYMAPETDNDGSCKRLWSAVSGRKAGESLL